MNEEDEDENIVRADYMYLVIIGNPDIILQIISELNKNVHKNIKYVAFPIGTPCAALTEMTLDNDLIFNEGIETAQCLIYAEEYKTFSMIMEVTTSSKFSQLSFPIIQLDDKNVPDKLIENWIINHIKNFNVETIVRPISIVGNKHDILVFIAIIDKIIEI